MQRVLDKPKPAASGKQRKVSFPQLLLLLVSGLAIVVIIGLIIGRTIPGQGGPGGTNTSSASTLSPQEIITRRQEGFGEATENDLPGLQELLRQLPYQGLDYRIEYANNNIIMKYDRSKPYARQAALTFLRQYDIFNSEVPIVEAPY